MDMDITTRCLLCADYLDGPCFDHTDVKRIVFDKPPVALAYASLPDVLKLDSVTGVTAPPKEKIVRAKQRIKTWTLFGPLIAPLAPLDEIHPDARRYTMWLEDIQELQAYDLSDDFLCNWIKFVRPSSSMAEANVVAYQQRGYVYLVAVRDILPTTELRVWVKQPSFPAISEDRSPSPIPYPSNLLPVCDVFDCPPVESQVSPGEHVGRGREDVASTSVEEMDFDEANRYRSPSPLQPLVLVGNEFVEGAGTKIQFNVPVVRRKRWSKSLVRLQDYTSEEDRKRIMAKMAKRAKRANAKVADRDPPKRARHSDRNQGTHGTTDRVVARARRPRVVKAMEEEIRRKLIAGIALTAEEQLWREQDLVHRRANNDKYRRKDRIAKGRDPEPLKIDNPGSFKKAPLFSWQLEEEESSSASSK